MELNHKLRSWISGLVKNNKHVDIQDSIQEYCLEVAGIVPRMLQLIRSEMT